MKLHRASLLLSLLTFALIVLGGVMHNLGAALSCPDWPLCYGELLSSQEGTRLAQAHRFLAAAVALLTLAIAIGAARRRPVDPGLCSLSRSAAILVLFQAALGGMGVLLLLPTLVSVAHLALGLGTFALSMALVFRTRPAWMAPDPASTPRDQMASLRSWADLAITALFVEMLLGAFLRHTGAGSALGTGPEAMFWPRDPVTGAFLLWPADDPGRWNLLHRISGLVTTAIVATAAHKIFYFARARHDRHGMALALGLILFTLGQIFLGVAGLAAHLDPAWVTAHLANAVLVLGLALTSRLRLGEAPGHEMAELDAALRAPLGDSDEARGRWGQSLLDAFVLTKPRLALLVVFTTAAGMTVAPGGLPLGRAALVTLFITMVVAAGTTLNMYQEIQPDARMERTRGRPLPAGRLHPRVALIQGWALALVGLPGVALSSNLLTAALAALALFSYLAIYTPLKSRSVAAVYVGALPGALPILMGWTAVTGHIDAGALALFAILFVWQIPHFIAISLYRSEEYEAAGFKILPLVYGERVALWHLLATSVALALATLAPSWLGMGSWLYRGISILMGLWIMVSALQGLSPQRPQNWARRFFLGTLIYLPVVLGVLVVDAAS